MKNFLLCLFLLLAGILIMIIFSLEFSKLSSYGLGYLAGKVVLLLICLICLYSLGKSILKKNFT
jgi:hypothetical protein